MWPILDLNLPTESLLKIFSAFFFNSFQTKSLLRSTLIEHTARKSEVLIILLWVPQARHDKMWKWLSTQHPVCLWRAMLLGSYHSPRRALGARPSLSEWGLIPRECNITLLLIFRLHMRNEYSWQRECLWQIGPPSTPILKCFLFSVLSLLHRTHR